jgi:His-Xaa-Ser system radical SAM maturase HxsB
LLNYFNYKKYGNYYLLTNDLGKYLFITKECFQKIMHDTVDESDNEYKALLDNYFISNKNAELFEKEASLYVREMKNYCFKSTALHIFAVTNICNLNCIYCQAKSDLSKSIGNMSFETGKKAIDFAMQSPNKYITFEFQGGEPLLNFDVVKTMIDYSKQICVDKCIEYSIVTNLTLLTDVILQYLIDNKIKICTSIDGPSIVHNHNRSYRNGTESYDEVICKVQKIKEKGVHINAIETTTNFSLNYPCEIVDEYINLGMDAIFLRPLTPLGMANVYWDKVGYTAEDFLQFYRTACNYIIERNINGQFFIESHANFFLKKIFRNYSDNYMELRSPCGASVGQLSYYYNGNIYTCDEGRMLSEMGDDSFKLGNVYNNNYEDIVYSPLCRATCKASIVECMPKCCDCVYQPYCGVCPVVNYAGDKDLYSRSVKNFRCKVYSGILDYLFIIIYENDEKKLNVLKSWVE